MSYLVALLVFIGAGALVVRHDARVRARREAERRRVILEWGLRNGKADGTGDVP